MLNDNSQLTYYQIVTNVTGPAHVGIEFYNPRMYGYSCHSGYSYGIFNFYKNTTTPISLNNYAYD